MAQASFAELEHDLKKRRTRRELFLELTTNETTRQAHPLNKRTKSIVMDLM